jgi:cytochrome c oxidase subunit 4
MAAESTHSGIPTPHVHDGGTAVLTYFFVFIALLVLLFITVGLAFIHTHSERTRDLLTATGFVIAGAKATLIILWFMHVKAGTRLTWVFASSAFVWLIIMFGLSLNDYAARGELPTQGGTRPHQTSDKGEPLEYRPENATGNRTER